MKIVLIGPPGSGKGSQANLVKKAYDIPHISTGDIFRQMMYEDSPIGNEVYKYMSRSKLVPDELVMKVMNEYLNRPEFEGGFLLDGFPRTLQQAKLLDKIIHIDKAILLDTTLDVVSSRVLKRRICPNCNAVYNIEFYDKDNCELCGTKLTMRRDDNKKTIKERYKDYETLTLPVVQYYKLQGKLEVIQAEQTIENVFGSVKKVLKRWV